MCLVGRTAACFKASHVTSAPFGGATPESIASPAKAHQKAERRQPTPDADISSTATGPQNLQVLGGLESASMARAGLPPMFSWTLKLTRPMGGGGNVSDDAQFLAVRVSGLHPTRRGL